MGRFEELVYAAVTGLVVSSPVVILWGIPMGAVGMAQRLWGVALLAAGIALVTRLGGEA